MKEWTLGNWYVERMAVVLKWLCLNSLKMLGINNSKMLQNL